MIAKVLLLLLGLPAFASSPAKASDGVSDTITDFLNLMAEEEPERASGVAEVLADVYESNRHLRDENILQCLRKAQHCWEGAVLDASTRPLCVVTSQACRTLVLTTSKPISLLQVGEQPATKSILYKTLDLCDENFDVSKLHQAAVTDEHLALALRHMEQKGVKFSSYCFVDFYAGTGARTIGFDPGRFEKGTYLGSPSPTIPSYAVVIDEATGQVIRGHYQK